MRENVSMSKYQGSSKGEKFKTVGGRQNEKKKNQKMSGQEISKRRGGKARDSKVEKCPKPKGTLGGF